MINFSDLPEMKESGEVLSNGEYKDIKPESVSKSEANDFWNDVFEEQSGPFENELSEEELLSKIYGRNEGEFDFDFDIDGNVQEILDKFDEDKWNNMDESEQGAFMILIELRESPDKAIKRISEGFKIKSPKETYL